MRKTIKFLLVLISMLSTLVANAVCYSFDDSYSAIVDKNGVTQDVGKNYIHNTSAFALDYSVNTVKESFYVSGAIGYNHQISHELPGDMSFIGFGLKAYTVQGLYDEIIDNLNEQTAYIQVYVDGQVRMECAMLGSYELLVIPVIDDNAINGKMYGYQFKVRNIQGGDIIKQWGLLFDSKNNTHITLVASCKRNSESFSTIKSKCNWRLATELWNSCNYTYAPKVISIISTYYYDYPGLRRVSENSLRRGRSYLKVIKYSDGTTSSTLIPNWGK